MKSSKKQLIKYINDGHNLEENLPIYCNEMCNAYYEFSLYQLSMEYYDLQDMYQEKKKIEELKLVIDPIQDVIQKLLKGKLNDGTSSSSLSQIEAVRNSIMERIDWLTMYADRFQVYEYILNRKELEYVKDINEIDEKEFLKKTVQYIFGSKDNYIVNESIKQVISQLPIRFTKNKFLDIVRESLNSFQGSDKKSLDTYLYMLRTSAMLYQPKTESSYYPNLEEALQELASADYKNLLKEQYEQLEKQLKESAAFIECLTDFFLIAQKVVNSLYIQVLTENYSNPFETETICKEIISLVNDNFSLKLSDEIEDRLAEKFEKLEGKIEESYEIVLQLASVLENVKNNYKTIADAMTLAPLCNRLFLCEKLSDNSAFIELEQESETVEVSDKMLEEVMNELSSEFKYLFDQNDKIINRAIMANTIDKLPVFFETADEIVDYVTNAVEQCSNVAEKTASMQIVMDIIKEDMSY